MGVEIKELIVRAVVGPEGSTRAAGGEQGVGSNSGHGSSEGSTRQRLRKLTNRKNER